MSSRPSDNRAPSDPFGMDEGYWQQLLTEGENDVPSAPAAQPESSSAYAYADYQDTWVKIHQTYVSDDTVELEVIGFNRGGLLVKWDMVRGFVPASHILNLPTDISDAHRKALLSRRVGEGMRLKIIELDEKQQRLILSERAALSQPGAREVILYKIRPGDKVRGTVTNTRHFGAFVDLGGVEGLIHVSQISWSRISHPSAVLSPGQDIEALVLNVNADEGRISLSLKELTPDPWLTVHDRYSIGQVIEGQVSNIVDYGVFVTLEPGLEGLIHTSELAEGNFMHPANVVSLGETIRACVVNIMPNQRKLGLTMRKSKMPE